MWDHIGPLGIWCCWCPNLRRYTWIDRWEDELFMVVANAD